MGMVKSAIRRWLERAGYDLRRSPMLNLDMVLRELLAGTARPVLFDIGANTGQTVRRFKRLFPASEIHAFEPSPWTFDTLRAASAPYRHVHLNCCGVGDRVGTLTLQENTHSDLSSFLPPGEHCWGTIREQTAVSVTTVDRYAAEREITAIDLLKTDTQGFDRQVLDGAAELIAAGRVRLILSEMNFIEVYQGQTFAPEYLAYMFALGYRLVGFYDYGYRDDTVSWCDALFRNLDYRPGEGDR